MKKTALLTSTLGLIIVAFIIVTSSCKKEDLEKTLTMNQQTIYFHANADAADGSDNILIDSTITSELKQQMEANGVSLDKVKSVKLKTCVLRIAANSVAQGITFDGYEFASAHIKAGSMAEQQLAFKTVIPQTQLTEISFDSQAQELADFLKQDNIELKVQAYNDVDVPATDYELDISYDVVYNVAK